MASELDYIDDRLFLVHNPSQDKRIPLVISELNDDLSKKDNEIVINDALDLNLLAKDRPYSPELSYPYMIENNGELHLVYTYARLKIEYVRIRI